MRNYVVLEELDTLKGWVKVTVVTGSQSTTVTNEIDCDIGLGFKCGLNVLLELGKPNPLSGYKGKRVEMDIINNTLLIQEV